MGYTKNDFEQWKHDLKQIEVVKTEWDEYGFVSEDEAQEYFIRNIVE